MENSIYQPPCINCITFPVCRLKIDINKFYLYENHRERYFNGMDENNRYYYMIRFIFGPLYDLCHIFRKYNDEEPVTQLARYIELKDLFYKKYN